MGDDYFCESGVSSGSTRGFHADDPLWDGEGCTGSSINVAHSTVLHAFSKNSLSLLLMPLKHEYALVRTEASPVEFIEL